MPAFTRIDRLSDAPAPQPTYLAVGSFDGVHRGHQAVLRQMVVSARQAGARTAVLTFFPHPKRVVANLSGRYYLANLDDRIELLAAQGIDLVVAHPFNEEVRHTRAADFVSQLVTHLDMRQLWGGNFALGYQREGDVPFLRQLGERLGYTVALVEAMSVFEGVRISSSRIRRALAEGNMEEVNGCLGRPFHLNGTVVAGDQRGRTIGFPTANLAVWDELILPAIGVYATIAEVNGRAYIAATNVGIRPTVDGQTLQVEAHLLDFSGDLYGARIRLFFHHRVRPEKKFAGLDELKAQIATDVSQVRRLLTD